jgi:DNA-binding transcriptional regulator GbsR (MarR family)
MEEMDKKVVMLFQEMARGQGLTDSLMTEIFARLYIEPEPIAMDDIAKKTGYSLASISNKVKLLGPLMHIKRIKKPGSKKVFLSMEKDIFSIWKAALVKKEEFVVKRVKDKMPAIIKEYKEKTKTKQDQKRIIILENYYKQIIKFEQVLKRIIAEINKIQ